MNSQFSDDSSEAGMHRVEKTTYCSPKLVEYGAMRDITLAVSINNKNDNAKSGPNKTS